MLRLNLGCGNSKLADYVNIDIQKSCNPDIVHDFVNNRLPFEDNSVERVCLFHTIEHIRKVYHPYIFSEIHRVLLDKKGQIFLSYPEFSEVAQRWLDNKKGKRDFWENTMFGRQLYPSDYHVCAMDSVEVHMMLVEAGFRDICQFKENDPNEFNTVMYANKLTKRITYEESAALDQRQVSVS